MGLYAVATLMAMHDAGMVGRWRCSENHVSGHLYRQFLGRDPASGFNFMSCFA